MGCQLIEELLIAYIDENLSLDEEEIIKNHLDNCNKCREEYEEIKSTIDYLIDNSENIATGKDIKLDIKVSKRKSRMNIGRTGLIAIALSLILVVTAFATDVFGLVSWKKFSENQLSEWEELIENGVGQKLNISTIDKDIRITAEGVIADELNTIIVLKIEDLKGDNKFTPAWDLGLESRPIFLEGDILKDKGMLEDIPPLASYDTLYSEDSNVTRLKIGTYPINKEEGDITIHINRLVGLYNESDIGVEGNWDLTIPVKFIESKTYLVNEDIDLDGSRLTIRRITLAPTGTNIEHEIKRLNEGKDYFINNISFLIKNGEKIYGRSNLNNRVSKTYHSDGTLTSDYYVENLFLEDPKEISLVVNSYEAASEDSKSYDIDWDKLPQTVEYRGSKITIEDIDYQEDSTRVIIKEDSSKDREYISSNFSFRIGETLDNEYPHRYKNILMARDIDSEVRDSEGKIIDPYNNLWRDEFYNYVFKQELILSEDDFKRHNIDSDKYKEYLIPGKLYIDGQEYKKFPNSEIKIELK